MKTNILSVALGLLTMTAIAQKDQVKNAEDAIDDGNYAEAKSQLKVAEANLSELNDKWQERYYFYKGQAFMGDGSASADDLLIAAEAFNKAKELGSSDAEEQLVSLQQNLVNSAIEDQNAQDYSSSAEKLVASYEITKQLKQTDTSYLYFAANNYVQAQEYDKAVEYLEQLNEMGYDGGGTNFTAVNTETGETESFSSKEQRDLMTKTAQYNNPGTEKIPSKKGDIAQLIARIYISEKKYDKAVDAMEQAKAANPGDVSLLQAEANMYYQMGEKDKARQILEKVAADDPSDPQTFNNIGLMYSEIGDQEKAKENFEKALEIDPEFNQARVNMVAAILGKERDIIEEMNGLGMSKDDNKRYEELNAERKALYNEAIPYLEEAIAKDPDNTDVIKTAMNIYTNLGNQEKVEEMKAMLEQ